MKRFFDSLIYGYWLFHKKPNAIFIRLLEAFLSWLLGLFGREVKPENREMARRIPGLSDVYLYGWLFGAIAMIWSGAICIIVQDLTGYSSIEVFVIMMSLLIGLYIYFTRNTTYESLMAEFEGESKAKKRWYVIQQLLVWIIPIVVMFVHLKFFVEYPA